MRIVLMFRMALFTFNFLNFLTPASLIPVPVMTWSDSYLVLSPTCLLSPGCPAPAHIAFSLPSYHFLTLPTQNTNTRTTPARAPLSASRCRSPGQCSVLSPSCALVSSGCPIYSVYTPYTAPLGSCEARCGQNPFSHPGQSCYCDNQCFNYGDCCQDYNHKCYSATQTTTNTSTATTLTARSGEERAHIEGIYKSL